MKSDTCLAIANPELAKEWHPTKNGSLTPFDVTPKSGQIVWWLLPYDDPETGKHFDFEWKARIHNRAAGDKCPYLRGRAIWKGYNDLATKRPDLAREWHPTKNGDLTPFDVTSKCGKKVWWLLPYDDPKTGKHFDFEWHAKIMERERGSGCPQLAGKKVCVGFNDLATTNPDVSAQWDYEKNELTPYEVTKASTKSVWWLCEKKHSWQARVTDRTRVGSCPICSKERATSFPEYAILFYTQKLDKTVIHTYQELGFELDIYIPSKKIAIEYDGEHWHLEKRQEDIEKNRKCKENGITLYRFREKTLGPLNDSSIDIPVNKRNFDFKLEKVLKTIFDSNVDIDTARDESAINDLRVYAEKRESLATSNPSLAKEWHPTKNGKLTPYDVTPMSAKEVWWLLPYDDPKTGKHFDFEWKAPIYRRNRGSGCPFLSNRRIWKGFNDLATVNPELAKEWHPTKNGKITPSDVTSGARFKAWWLVKSIDPITQKLTIIEFQAPISRRTIDFRRKGPNNKASIK